MKLVALLSGGKDSCFNMMHCIANGHEIVALANLKPSESSHKYELDSYMYQTVGYDGIKYISECMGIPLFQNDIVGDCIVSGLDYVPTKNDEVEDLYNLLLKIKTQFPEIEGVSVGAILSNFQRVRVENICNRLNLKVFAYLWRIDQIKLLKDMISSHLTAVLVKVAAIGLNNEHLNKSLDDMYDYFIELYEKYGNNVCGEGGEYETFTIDCPLFSKRIVVDEYDVNKYGEAFAPVCNLRFKKVHLEDKKEKPGLTEEIRQLLLDNSNFKHLEILPPTLSKSNKVIRFESKDNTLNNTQESNISIYNKEPYLVLSGVTATKEHNDIKEETREVMNIIDETLKNNNYEWSNIILMTVYIKNMSEFGNVNSIYKEYFSINPPPRVCVALNLPDNKNISIDCVCTTTESDKKQCMHVQSISYWAPANIGPYSQSVVVNGSGYIAGQIGLIPCTSELPKCDTEEESLASETQMSLHSLENIVSVLPFKMRNDSVHCTCFVTDPSYFTYVQEEWKKFMKSSVPINFVCIPTLPKNSKVEWQLMLYNKNNELRMLSDEEELALELELEDIADNDANVKDDSKRECLEYQLDETLDNKISIFTHGIRKTFAFHFISNVKYEDCGEVCTQDILEKSVDALFNGLSKGIQSLHMKDNGIQLQIFYLDSTPKSIISEVVNKKCETIHYYGNDNVLNPSISFIPVCSLPENVIISSHLYGFN